MALSDKHFFELSFALNCISRRTVFIIHLDIDLEHKKSCSTEKDDKDCVVTNFVNHRDDPLSTGE